MGVGNRLLSGNLSPTSCMFIHLANTARRGGTPGEWGPQGAAVEEIFRGGCSQPLLCITPQTAGLWRGTGRGGCDCLASALPKSTGCSFSFSMAEGGICSLLSLNFTLLQSLWTSLSFLDVHPSTITPITPHSQCWNFSGFIARLVLLGVFP